MGWEPLSKTITKQSRGKIDVERKYRHQSLICAFSASFAPLALKNKR
ncbi:hypothetical protein BGS_0021 [Beggiatoa sp. SS]|nr:hypothetical protein BGS_0021 [Beggiatoa sp. SS]